MFPPFRQMNCCGVVSPLDYYESAWYNTTLDATGKFVPVSCCRPVPPENDPFSHIKQDSDPDSAGYSASSSGEVARSFKEDFYNEEMKRYKNLDYFYPYNDPSNFRSVRSNGKIAEKVRKKYRNKRHFRAGSLHQACNSSCHLSQLFNQQFSDRPKNLSNYVPYFHHNRLDGLKLLPKKNAHKRHFYSKRFPGRHSNDAHSATLGLYANTTFIDQRLKNINGNSIKKTRTHTATDNTHNNLYNRKYISQKTNENHSVAVKSLENNANVISNVNNSWLPQQSEDVASRAVGGARVVRSAKDGSDDAAKEYMCQLEALRLRRPETPAPFKQLYSQVGCVGEITSGCMGYVGLWKVVGT